MSEAWRESHQFAGLIKASHRLAGQDAAQGPQLARARFTTVQWAQTSQAATSIAQMGARQARGGGALAGLVRERQDLVEDWQAKDKLLIMTRSAPPENRNSIHTHVNDRTHKITSSQRGGVKDCLQTERTPTNRCINCTAILGNLRQLALFITLVQYLAWNII